MFSKIKIWIIAILGGAVGVLAFFLKTQSLKNTKEKLNEAKDNVEYGKRKSINRKRSTSVADPGDAINKLFGTKKDK